MDRIEDQLLGTTQENLVKQHFGGLVSKEIICKDCPHYYEREEHFLALNLDVKNKRNILHGLESYIEGEILDGDNAYYCAECKTKVKAMMRTTVKKLPKYLILVLKRFEFDFERGIKQKINEYCEFPFELDMQPFTYDELHKNKKEKAQGLINETSQFSLRGVIIHSGFADSGHYYSLIKDKKDGKSRWLEFNDQYVTNFDLTRLPYVAFGKKEAYLLSPFSYK